MKRPDIEVINIILIDILSEYPLRGEKLDIFLNYADMATDSYDWWKNPLNNEPGEHGYKAFREQMEHIASILTNDSNFKYGAQNRENYKGYEEPENTGSQ